MNRNTMVTPCIVNRRLYVSAVTNVYPGLISSIRKSSAKTPPSKSARVVAMRNMSPMRLWSVVASQDQMVVLSLR